MLTVGAKGGGLYRKPVDIRPDMAVKVAFSLADVNCPPVDITGKWTAKGDYASASGHPAVAKLGDGGLQGSSIAERRAALVVRCARELLGDRAPTSGDLHLPLSVTEFEQVLRERYGSAHPDLVYRTDSTLERARLERRSFPHLPKVVLRQGAPRRAERGRPHFTPESDPGHA